MRQQARQVTNAAFALVVGTMAGGGSTAARAAVVWADNFAGQTLGAFPAGNYAGGAAGADYANTTSSAAASFAVSGIGNASPAVGFTDTSTSVGATVTVTMNQFAPFVVSPTSPTSVLRMSYDFRVDGHLNSGSNTPRFVLRANNVTNTGSQFVAGLGYANLNDGDASTTDLALYVETQTGATTNNAPRDATAIGLLAGTGWQNGFDFGNYTAADESANDTNDEFYRFAIDYNAVTGGISGTVTQLSTGLSAALPAGLGLTPGATFSNDDANDRFLLASGAAATGTAYWDNFVVEAIVPEPSGATAGLLGLAAMAAHRRHSRHRTQPLIHRSN